MYDHSSPNWMPTCDLSALKTRAEVYAQIRAFFSARQVLEVETPLLSVSTASDPFLDSISAFLKHHQGESDRPYFLNTSPEFPMKRLLASGSGSIFQICKTFRNAETGKRHNPEFTMLEWYRPGFSLMQLMQEVGELLECVLGEKFNRPTYLSYREAFLNFLQIDPFLASDAELIQLAKQKTGFQIESESSDQMERDDYLNLLLSVCIEPHLGKNENEQASPLFLYGYPPSQASLAKVKEDEFGEKVAQRFELYINALEIANGYDELTDAKEQRRRFEADNTQRKKLGLMDIPLDEHLLSAIESGLPECAGVALGIDRLLMIKQKRSRIEEVISFPIARA